MCNKYLLDSSCGHSSTYSIACSVPHPPDQNLVFFQGNFPKNDICPDCFHNWIASPDETDIHRPKLLPTQHPQAAKFWSTIQQINLTDSARTPASTLPSPFAMARLTVSDNKFLRSQLPVMVASALAPASVHALIGGNTNHDVLPALLELTQYNNLIRLHMQLLTESKELPTVLTEIPLTQLDAGDRCPCCFDPFTVDKKAWALPCSDRHAICRACALETYRTSGPKCPSCRGVWEPSKYYLEESVREHAADADLERVWWIKVLREAMESE